MVLWLWVGGAITAFGAVLAAIPGPAPPRRRHDRAGVNDRATGRTRPNGLRIGAKSLDAGDLPAADDPGREPSRHLSERVAGREHRARPVRLARWTACGVGLGALVLVAVLATRPPATQTTSSPLIGQVGAAASPAAISPAACRRSRPCGGAGCCSTSTRAGARRAGSRRQSSSSSRSAIRPASGSRCWVSCTETPPPTRPPSRNRSGRHGRRSSIRTRRSPSTTASTTRRSRFSSPRRPRRGPHPRWRHGGRPGSSRGERGGGARVTAETDSVPRRLLSSAGAAGRRGGIGGLTTSGGAGQPAHRPPAGERHRLWFLASRPAWVLVAVVAVAALGIGSVHPRPDRARRRGSPTWTASSSARAVSTFRSRSRMPLSPWRCGPRSRPGSTRA